MYVAVKIATVMSAPVAPPSSFAKANRRAEFGPYIQAIASSDSSPILLALSPTFTFTHSSAYTQSVDVANDSANGVKLLLPHF